MSYSVLKHLLSRRLATMALLLVGAGALFVSSAQVVTPTTGVSNFVPQVSANSTGFPGSTTAFRPGDFPQWTGSYLEPIQSTPQWKEHQIDFPTAQPYKRGEVKYPYGYVVSYKVGNSWSNVEPADNALLQSVKFRYDPVSSTLSPPPAASVNFSGGGDGYEVLSYQGKLYVVNHHSQGRVIKCFDAVTAQPCAGWAGGKAALGNTPNQSLAAINRSNGNLYFPSQVGWRYGFECFNVHTATSCGFKTYDDFGSYIGSDMGYGQQTSLGVVGNRLYALSNTTVVGCIDVSTGNLCYSSPKRIASITPQSVRAGLVAGTRLYFYDDHRLFCFDASSDETCSGWPVNVANPAGPFSLVDASGSPKAICGGGTQGVAQCFTLEGLAYTPNGNEQGVRAFNVVQDGYIRAGLTHKRRVFAIDKDEYIQCLNLDTGTSCNGFPKSMAKGSRPYTLALDAERADCIWSNSDQGSSYSFDALTGGACSGSSSTPVVLIAKPREGDRCMPTNIDPTWRAIVLSAPAAGTVTAKIFNASTSALIATRQFSAGSNSLSISDIPFSVHSELRVELTLGSSGTAQSVAAEIVWDGPAPQFCVQTKTSAANCDISGNWSAMSGLVGSTNTLYTSSITGKGLSFAAPVQGYSVSSTVSSSDLAVSPLVFKGRFDERLQTGDLWITRLDANTGNEMLDVATGAPKVLVKATTSRVIPAASSRRVLTQSLDTLGVPARSIPFVWSQLDPIQQGLLNRNLQNVPDTLGSKRVDYLRGSAADESPDATVPLGKFRKRNGPLGMVLGSGMSYVPTVALQSRSEKASPGYENFLLNPPRTKNQVYFAANDGMLHAFNVVDSGTNSVSLSEQFAYLPKRLLGVMNRYSDSTAFQLWANPYFHDNTPMVNDIYRNGAWSTVLVSAFGRGAPGFAALNITRGDAVTEQTTDLVIREFTDQDDADMGYIVSQPTLNAVGYASQIVNVKRGGQIRPAVIVGNGINSSNARAVLFIVFLDTTGGYEKHILPGTSNGLSTPRVLDLSGDGVADTVYAGDLLGNVWRMDISNATSSAISSTRLYIAMAPIVSAPLAQRFTPVGACRYCMMVNVATGRPTTGPLLYDFSPGTHAVYGLWDKVSSTPISSSDLVAQTVAYSSSSLLTVSNRSVNYAASPNPKRGWVFPLPNEQMVVANPVFRDSGVMDIFAISKPGWSATTCLANNGWAYALYASTGNTPPRTFDINNDGLVNTTDLVTVAGNPASSVAGIATNARNFGQVAVASKAGSDVIKNVNADGSTKAQGGRVNVAGRLSWHEMDR